jgi:hypothetical protein
MKLWEKCPACNCWHYCGRGEACGFKPKESLQERIDALSPTRG